MVSEFPAEFELCLMLSGGMAERIDNDRVDFFRREIERADGEAWQIARAFGLRIKRAQADVDPPPRDDGAFFASDGSS